MQLRHSLLVLTLILLTSCGGGGGSTGAGSDNADSPLDLQGNWHGTLATTPLACMIHADGPMLCYDSGGGQYIASHFIVGASSFTGNGVALPSANADASGDQLKVKGSGDASGVSGQFTFLAFEPGPESGSNEDFTLHPYQPLKGSAFIQAGHWTGFYPGTTANGGGGSTGIEVDVTAPGDFTGTDSYGCALKGSFTPVAGASDLFSVSISRSGSMQCDLLKPATGLAYESDTDDLHLFAGAPGPYYYVIVWTMNDLIETGALLVFKAE